MGNCGVPFYRRKIHRMMVQENSTMQIMLRAGVGDSVQNTEKLCIIQDEKEREKGTLTPGVIQHYHAFCTMTL